MSRNIVLLTVDSLRADHCSFTGYDRETTPTLDAMAANGMVFENAIAPGPTTPESMPAIFTGEYPTGQGDAADGGLRSHRELTRRHLASRVTLAEQLQRRGYATAGFTPNPWTSHHFGFQTGFDTFEDFLGSDRSSDIWERMLEGRGSKTLAGVRLLASWLQRENTFKPWRAFYDEAVGWVSSAEEPYFLWLFLLDTHFPYFTGSEDRTQARWRTYEANLRLYLEDQDSPYRPRVHNQLVTAYDDAIGYVDRCLARLRRDLSEDDPVIVVHGDHGEGFGEHGTYGHHDQLFESNVHVPLVIDGLEPGSTPRPVSLRQLPSILCAVADGDELGRVDDRRPWTSTRSSSKTAVRGGTWKYRRSDEGEAFHRLPDEHTAIEDGPGIEVTRRLDDTFREHGRECSRLSKAAVAAAEGGP